MVMVLGIITILFGLVSVTFPEVIFDIFIIAIGIILVIFGILTAGVALSAEPGFEKTMLLGSGLISIIIGLLALLSPFVATVAIAYLIAIWLVVNGLITIAYAISVTWERHRILTGISGAISLLIGLYLFIFPVEGTAFLTMVIGIFFIISGIISLIMGVCYWKK